LKSGRLPEAFITGKHSKSIKTQSPASSKWTTTRQITKVACVPVLISKKNYKCSHIYSMAVLEKIIDFTAAARQVKIPSNTQQGRIAAPSPALVRD